MLPKHLRTAGFSSWRLNFSQPLHFANLIEVVRRAEMQKVSEPQRKEANCRSGRIDELWNPILVIKQAAERD
jgi:hypothetical protein